MYANDRWDNPPPVMEAQSQHTEPHTLASEEFENMRNRRNPPPAAQQMSYMRAIRDTKSYKGSNYFFEIFCYSVFLIVLLIASFASVSSQSFYYTKIMGDTFRDATTDDGTNLDGITEIDNIWDYLSQVLVRGLYYDNVVWNGTEEGMVLYENRLLGQPTLRLLKVKNDSCTVVESFSREIKDCFANYNKKAEDTNSFGDGHDWSSSDELETNAIHGDVTIYEGGGFVTKLPLDNPEEAQQIVQALRDERWIDRGTRAVIIDFALYNGNVNLFCVVRLLFELPATGGVIPHSNFFTAELMRNIGTSGDFKMAIEGIFVGFILFFVFNELLEIVRQRFRYFTDVANVLDIVIVIVAIVSCFLSYSRGRIGEKRINKIIQSGLTKAAMDDVVDAETYFSNVTSILLFMAWIKAFKFISVNRTMSQLSSTLSRSAKDIGGFAIMFSVFFFAYAQFGYLVFGTQIEDYSTFYGSVFALLRTILGDFNYPALATANRILGPVFFISYVFFVFFVLLNMFLAIINDSYVEVKAELARKTDTGGFVSWFQERTAALINRKNHAPEGPESSQVTYDSYKKQLILVGYKEEDIDMTFTKMDVEGEALITESMMREITNEVNELNERRRDIEHDHTKYLVVNRRVDALESALGASVRRLETAMAQMAMVEERKVIACEFDNKQVMREKMFPPPPAVGEIEAPPAAPVEDVLDEPVEHQEGLVRRSPRNAP